jgi:hypothetical protein
MSKEIVGLLSNKLNVSDQYTQVLEIGPTQFQPYSYSADSAGGYGTQIQFNNIVPIGSLSQTLLSKNMRVSYDVQVVVVASGAPGAGVNTLSLPTDSLFNNSLNQAVNAGFRAFPLQEICDTVQISLNSSTQTWNARQTISGLQRLLDQKALMTRVGEAPVRPDNQYTLLPDNVGVDHVLSTSARANLSYSRNSIQCTAFNYNAGTTTYTYNYHITENLIIPGINSLWDNEVELANINNLSLILTYSSLQTDFLCCAPIYSSAALPVLVPYTNAAPVITISDPRLQLFYNTVDPNIVSIPRSVVYPYENINWFVQNPSVVDLQVYNSAQYNINSNTIRLLSCPKYIGFWFRQAINSRTTASFQADACLALNTGLGCVSINYGAKNGLLSQCDRDSIYRFSRECGSNQTHEDFVGGSGSWAWCDPTKHFGLDSESLHVGEGGSVNLQINAQYTNQNCKASLQTTVANSTLSAAASMEFVVVVIYEGQMIITPDMVNFSLSVLSPAEISTLMNRGSIVSKEAVKMEGKGAGLYTDKNVLSKGARRKGGVMSAAGLGGAMK